MCCDKLLPLENVSFLPDARYAAKYKTKGRSFLAFGILSVITIHSLTPRFSHKDFCAVFSGDVVHWLFMHNVLARTHTHTFIRAIKAILVIHCKL